MTTGFAEWWFTLCTALCKSSVADWAPEQTCKMWTLFDIIKFEKYTMCPKFSTSYQGCMQFMDYEVFYWYAVHIGIINALEIILFSEGKPRVERRKLRYAANQNVPDTQRALESEGVNYHQVLSTHIKPSKFPLTFRPGFNCNPEWWVCHELIAVPMTLLLVVVCRLTCRLDPTSYRGWLIPTRRSHWGNVYVIGIAQSHWLSVVSRRWTAPDKSRSIHARGCNTIVSVVAAGGLNA